MVFIGNLLLGPLHRGLGCLDNRGRFGLGFVGGCSGLVDDRSGFVGSSGGFIDGRGGFVGSSGGFTFVVGGCGGAVFIVV